MPALPFLTAYDPPGSSEGTLDPLGLYMTAEQLATRLVPAVRERMARVRFLTAIAVGALVTEEVEPNPRYPDTPPLMVWEWLVVEAIVRAFSGDAQTWGVPGTLVTRKALAQYGYVDQRSYLKTARVFGFHGVYKRLAIHLGLVDTHMRFRAPRGEELVAHWGRDRDIARFDADHPLYEKWRKAIENSLRQTPVHTCAHWASSDWHELAAAFLPHGAKRHEKRCLRRLLHSEDDGYLGALSTIWRLVANLDSDEIEERRVHAQLEEEAPNYAVLLEAIAAYESFCRNLSSAFDILRADGSRADARGFAVADVGRDDDFRGLAGRTHHLFRDAALRLTEVGLELDTQFSDRFIRFAEPLPPSAFAQQLCEHHEAIQQGKSRDGKRPWFDKMGTERIYMRQNYRLDERPELSNSYVHQYRTLPIYRFYSDLR